MSQDPSVAVADGRSDRSRVLDAEVRAQANQRSPRRRRPSELARVEPLGLIKKYGLVACKRCRAPIVAGREQITATCRRCGERIWISECAGKFGILAAHDSRRVLLGVVAGINGTAGSHGQVTPDKILEWKRRGEGREEAERFVALLPWNLGK